MYVEVLLYNEDIVEVFYKINWYNDRCRVELEFLLIIFDGFMFCVEIM